jgi:hypothetical protein
MKIFDKILNIKYKITKEFYIFMIIILAKNSYICLYTSIF